MSDEVLWSETRPDRVQFGECEICGAADGDDCSEGVVHSGRRWEIGLTWPGRELLTREVALTGVCQATVEDRDEYRQGRRRLSYRGACVGCGWAANDVCDDESRALADALDHALPGWRTTPVVTRVAYDASARQVTAWLNEVGKLYAALGLNARLAPGNGGVIRTMRREHQERSHHTGHYYDVCAGTTTAQRRTSSAAPTQIALF